MKLKEVKYNCNRNNLVNNLNNDNNQTTKQKWFKFVTCIEELIIYFYKIMTEIELLTEYSKLNEFETSENITL